MLKWLTQLCENRENICETIFFNIVWAAFTSANFYTIPFYDLLTFAIMHHRHVILYIIYISPINLGLHLTSFSINHGLFDIHLPLIHRVCIVLSPSNSQAHPFPSTTPKLSAKLYVAGPLQAYPDINKPWLTWSERSKNYYSMLDAELFTFISILGLKILEQQLKNNEFRNFFCFNFTSPWTWIDG